MRLKFPLFSKVTSDWITAFFDQCNFYSFLMLICFFRIFIDRFLCKLIYGTVISSADSFPPTVLARALRVSMSDLFWIFIVFLRFVVYSFVTY